MTSNTDLIARLREAGEPVKLTIGQSTPINGDLCIEAASTILSLSSHVEGLREALEYALYLMWEYGFTENDLQPIRAALAYHQTATRETQPCLSSTDETQPASETAEARVAALSEALAQCADRLERCAILSGTSPEYAAIAVEAYRNALSGTGK